MISSSSALDVPSGGSKLGLFTNQIIKFVILGLGCLFSVMIGVQVTDSEANGVSVFMRYVAASTFITAMISPRIGIYLVLFMCPVLDLVKRTLILFDAISMFDVASVLAVAPVTMAGAVVGTFGTRVIFRRKGAIPGERTLFVIMTAITSLIVISGYLHNQESKLSLLRDLAEACIYLCLILLIPVYFPTTEDIASLLRWCVVVFVPVALYGFWQQAFGLSNFEQRYLMSGLTITADDYITNARVFSTLNSNHSFSVSMACCAVIALMQRQLPAGRAAWQRFVHRRGRLLFILFCAATIVSLRRTGWLVVVFSLLGAYCFRSRARTLIFYASCLCGAALLIFNAETIYTNLPVWEGALQHALPGHDQALVLQTFNDRLASFETLRDNRAIWSFFGLTEDEKTSVFVHDAITQTLVGYGAVGLVAFLSVLVLVLTVSHRLVWRSTSDADRKYAALLLGFIFSNLFVGAIMQTHIDIFPVNFIFWVCAGALLKITFNQQSIVQVKPKLDLEALAAAIKASKRQPKPVAILGGYTLPGR